MNIMFSSIYYFFQICNIIIIIFIANVILI